MWFEDPNADGSPDDLTGLAEIWDSSQEIRHATIERKSLLVWESPKTTGQISQQSLLLNLKLIDSVVDYWCPKTKNEARTVHIDNMKWQAGFLRFQ